MSDPTDNQGEPQPQSGFFSTLKLKITALGNISGDPVEVEVVYDRVVVEPEPPTEEPLPPPEEPPPPPEEPLPLTEGPDSAERLAAASGASDNSFVSSLDSDLEHPNAAATENPLSDTAARAEPRTTPPIHSREKLRFPLNNGHPGENATTEKTLTNVDYPSTATIQFLASDGIPRVLKFRDITSADALGIDIELTLKDIENIQKKFDLPDPRPVNITRTGLFMEVAVDNLQPRFEFARARLLTAPLSLSETGKEWDLYGFPDFFKITDGPKSVAAAFTQALPGTISSLPWTTTRLGVDGRFTASFYVPHGKSFNAWAWLLTGNRSNSMLGIVYPDDISAGILENDYQLRAIILPVPTQGSHGGSDIAPNTGSDGSHENSESRVPVIVSETELANNPEVYTEDPGSFCKPFRNPERILSEKSFFSVLRVDQPEISAAASRLIAGPVLDFEKDAFVRDLPFTRGAGENVPRQLPLFKSSLWSDRLIAMGSGRETLDASHPLQWEGDIFRYQATSLAKGHILEFRVRTRSNGYSLGSVAKTITLAPRQTRRIQKVEWARSEQASRAEVTRLADSMNENMAHNTSYQAAASASLDEWSQGSSRSKTGGGAGGFGFAYGSFVVGGGATRGSATSSSQQSGGRTITASEESQWRDAIRRHGDSLRKLESTVVQEVDQAESVIGTTETIRNINYAHSLTIIYHNILRHLRVDTEFSAARECLFVPFAIRPFTTERALRWKNSISRALRDLSFSKSLTYLKDVVTNFASSSIPPGRRSDLPVKSLRGTLYLDLAIIRPSDQEDGKFNEATWKKMSPILPASPLAIYQTLAATDAAVRDYIFQQRYAPFIAAGWCNALELKDSRNTSLKADFTLATPYKFNSTIRVDFQVPLLDGLSRETLSTISIFAGRELSAGSKANIKAGLEINYETDFHKGSISPSTGAQDLIIPDTGAIDPGGALLAATPSVYDRQDLRQELRMAVNDLVGHLNENVEHYHRAIWWNMDRDRLFMLLDGFTVPRLGNTVSIANAVERDPVAVAGNCLIFRVSAGSFLGNPELSIETSNNLYDYYNSNSTIADPMHISLPTDGLYAQAIMDECSALEDHHGNKDWALTDPDPELTAQDPGLLLTRKSEAQNTTPTALPGTIINLSNTNPAPSPQGFADVLGAVQNANAFKEMTGLSKTQQLAQSSLDAAASLATSFGNSAAALETSRITGKQQATADADKKVASIQQARDKRLISSDQAAAHVNRILGELAGPTPIRPPYEDPEVQGLLSEIRENGVASTFESSNAAGKLIVTSGDTDSVFPTSSRPKGRPAWSRFKKVYWDYVNYSSRDVFESVDERWVTMYTNTCALRLTKALNDYGSTILASANKIPGVHTDKSLTKRRYIISVDGVRAYLEDQWGPADVIIPNKGKLFDPASHIDFKNKPGVIIFKIDFKDATGHVDLWYGDKFSHEKDGGWDGAGTPPKDYWSVSTNIMLWHLKDPVGGAVDSDSGNVVV